MTATLIFNLDGCAKMQRDGVLWDGRRVWPDSVIFNEVL